MNPENAEEDLIVQVGFRAAAAAVAVAGQSQKAT